MSANFSSSPACSPIIPIYPVRYAYINIFDELVPADHPPELSVMMNNRDVEKTKGYAIRLLREGWVYIREEDSNELLHIFKYTQKQVGESVTEIFEKYLYKNRKNAQGGLVLDTSVKNLPFAFVSANTSKISIVYTQHELSPNLIDRMHQNREVRIKSMQLIDLSAEQTSYSIAATANNLKSLVEDYRDFQSRMLTRVNADGGKVDELSLDILTTQPSYNLETDLMVEQLQKTYCSRERARIVTLFDPIGRQIELSQVHAKLALWEREYLKENVYPHSVGKLVDLFINSDNPETKEMAQENIDIKGHEQFWKPIDNNIKSFISRREEILGLFEFFSKTTPDNSNKGSSTDYVRNFIDTETNYHEQLQYEIDKLTSLGSDLFEGITTTKEGMNLVERLMEQINNQDYSNPFSLMSLFGQSLVQLITTPQDGFNWNDVVKIGIDRTFFWLGPVLANLYTTFRYGAPSKYSSAKYRLMKYTADVLIPKLLSTVGIELTGGVGKYTTEELGNLLAKAINRGSSTSTPSSIKAGESILERAENRLAKGQALFDWTVSQGESAATDINPKKEIWELEEIRCSDDASKRVHSWAEDLDGSQYSATGKTGIIFDGSFAGLSAYLNLVSIFSIVLQSDFDKSDPLAYTGKFYAGTQLASTLAALTTDTLAIARTGLVAGQVVVNTQLFSKIVSPAAASSLLPGLRASTKLISTILAGRLVSSLIAAANIGAATLSFIDAYHSFNNGNTGLGVGYSCMGVGASLIFLGGLAGASAGSGVGIPAAIVFGGIMLIISGAVFVSSFQKNVLENLLYNCFWGSNSRYPFWKHYDGEDLKINKRLSEAKLIESKVNIMEAYQVEIQEFMNLLMMPKLEIHTRYHQNSTYHSWNSNSVYNHRTYQYDFILPNFKFGVSQLFGGVYVLPEVKGNNHYVHGIEGSSAYRRVFSEDLTNRFKSIFQEKITEKIENYDAEEDGGNLHISMTMEAEQDVELRWYYKPSPKVLVPMRWLKKDGGVRQPILGLVDDNL